jgi:amino acid adenylation domain-containing protein
VTGQSSLTGAALPDSEWQRLTAWNSTASDYPPDRCVHQLVAAQASANPDAVAVATDDLSLTYLELNRRANQLANHLQSLGVGPDLLVGCCLERSLDLVVALLGILKAGGAYLPLDPAYPHERLAFQLRDADTSALLTTADFAADLPVRSSHVVCMDVDQRMLGALEDGEPKAPVTGDHLAYVIYTSGSTGLPKGVEITHNGLLNLVFWHHQAFAVTPADRATQVTSPAFDATGWELWPYLSAGASVYLPPGGVRATAASLRDWLLSRRITVTFQPTRVAESLMSLDWPSTSSLRLLLTGADSLQAYPDPGLPFAVVNNYGPTEATVVATSGLVPPDPSPAAPPTIGRPITNTKVHILDEELRPVPVGEAGEIYIGGHGVARGYLKRPDLTAERFIPDPFQDGQARLYRTGDIARHLPDGQIAFLGRADHQIKLNGYRIEPGEVAHALNRHAAVKTSVVVDREDVTGAKGLIAYLILREGSTVQASSLREALAAQLPAYMIPSGFVVLDALPLTVNGKLDRAAMPAPDAGNTLRDATDIAPRTPIEERLSSMVTTLLQVQSIGIDDNFFLNGGSSMMGTQIIVRTSETFGVDLPLRTLFELPTVRGLAAEIERQIVARLEHMSEEDALRLLQ